MGTKETIAASYIEDWHDRTRNWTYPDIRQAAVFGVDENNIGEAIANHMLEDQSFQIVDRFNKQTLNLLIRQDRFSCRWQDYDTVVFANGNTNLNWIEDQDDDMISRVVNDKLTATILGVRRFVLETLDMPWIKNIVLIGSMAHRSVLNGSAPYCAACAGLAHFARCIAWELAPKGYKVFILNPSNVEGTPMTEATIQGLMNYRDLDREQAEEYWGAVRALPRWLQTENIAGIVRDLVTNPNYEWLSGVPLDLGGGLR
jgi:NAD(P)-dependent dehydrogenase (short-subunit alcohol dehydrogenase family)